MRKNASSDVHAKRKGKRYLLIADCFWLSKMQREIVIVISVAAAPPRLQNNSV